MRLTRRVALIAAGSTLLCSGGGALLPGSLGAQESNRWKIHEWGTFSSLMNERGLPIGWINTEDEPLPEFVHRLDRSLVVALDDLAPVFFKGAPRNHPDVLVRLETPVVYFHPPKQVTLPATVDLSVKFNGGWLTEFYPDAKVTAPGLERRDAEFGRITPRTVGTLEWKGIQVGKKGAFPETKDAVWTSPRDVQCAPLTMPAGESEQFLFYRGVAFLQPPLAAGLAEDGKTLTLMSRLPAELASKAPLRIAKLWYVDIREDGALAFRTLPMAQLPASGDGILRTIPGLFADGDYSLTRLADLRKEMHAGLVADGLFDDEAAALLNTWEASYFRSHGARLFFMVPKAWTDHVLPLKSSVPADVERVMIGRLELITPRQRACLKRIAASKEFSTAWYFDWMQKHPQAAARNAKRRAEGDLQSLREDCVSIPDNYLAYLQMGRFRNALLLDAFRRTADFTYKKFIEAYDLVEASVPPRSGR
jgi:hypothetical protein